MNDDWAYEEVARELQKQTMVPGVWARAFAEAGGDKEKGRAFYIKYRVAQLIEERKRDAYQKDLKATEFRKEARQKVLKSNLRHLAIAGALNATICLALLFFLGSLRSLNTNPVFAIPQGIIGLALSVASVYLVKLLIGRS